VILPGSHFVFRGFAARYRALLPAGAAGTFHGRYVVQGYERGVSRQPAVPAPAHEEEEEIPSLQELAAMLEGADG
jgi:hypothetical protein